MIDRDELLALLQRARKADPDFKIFGARAHHYELNPPLDEAIVRQWEAELGITFSEDYVRFITQIGNGGAGPNYGIEPLEDGLKLPEDPQWVPKRKAYRESLARPFTPRPMLREEVEAGEFSYALHFYDSAPENLFVYEGVDEENWWWSDGILTLGTKGCQWDFGLVTQGERRGQIFEIDNEGGFLLLAPDFDTFYQEWMDELAEKVNAQRPRLFGGLLRKLRK